jgi:hypothetical protein
MSVSVAQIILIALIVAVIVYIFTVRSVSRDRTAMLTLAAVGCILVIWPGLSTDVARAVGIGRGTDLLFYLFVVFCLFRFVSTAAEMRRVNDRVTRVVRDSALQTARPAPDSGPATGHVATPEGRKDSPGRGS